MAKVNTQTVAAIRLAAATLTSHGVWISIHKDGAHVFLMLDQMIALCKTEKAKPTTKPLRGVEGCYILEVTLDGLIYTTTCMVDELQQFDLQPPTTAEGAQNG